MTGVLFQVETFRNKIMLSAALILLLISAGTVGYVFIEGWDFLDSLYMTITTLTTVGFGEVHPLSRIGRVFTIALIVGGVGTVFYALGTIAKFMLEGEFEEIFGRKRLEKKIKELREHFIVCGYGRMGKIICRELKEKNISFVVIEKKPEALIGGQDVLLVEGDATRDEILKEVQIGRARGLISVLPTDAENLYVVLSARGLNPRLMIVARAGEEGSEQKLVRAGADRVVSPYYIGGLRIAHTVLKPAVVDFIEFATKSGNIDLQMEEITIQDNSGLVGLTLDECGIGRELGIIVVAIKQGSGEMRFNPTYRTAIRTGDTLIALGEISKLKILEDMALAKVK
ncbi:MAG TPA: potassium channel protein [Candidatus Sulfobium mesophilum]|uniref:Potassium uptake protein, TrkA family n=1 Tax=Candidatus Sulfobium mesophilum TaxID=2016548 RepID=A0A2U3QK78_9BACT|nr:Potassium uptake protein, TrkA family [Candidatus Sulfobium mesophilum]HSB31306.1 potassium channel protein [Candidatus Sulfobium mesophilum]